MHTSAGRFLTIRTTTTHSPALVPASLLPVKTQWQRIAKSLPKGSTLLMLPASPNRQRKTFEQVAAQLRQNGKQVSTLSAKQVFQGYRVDA
jgi:hypothetical protein